MYLCGCSPRPCLNTFEGIVLPEQDGGQLKMYSLSSRLEMYVDQAVWHKLARQGCCCVLSSAVMSDELPFCPSL